MKKATLLLMATLVALSFGACQSHKTAALNTGSKENSDCCKSDAQPVKKFRFR